MSAKHERVMGKYEKIQKQRIQMKTLLKSILILCVIFCITACEQGNTASYPVSDERGEQLRLLTGEIFRFSDYRGKWVIINYWASWCAPCIEEIPALKKLQADYPDKVVVIGVNYDFIEASALKALVKKWKITYPSLITDPAQQLNAGAIDVVPTTFIISPEGNVVARKVGEQTTEDFEAVIKTYTKNHRK